MISVMILILMLLFFAVLMLSITYSVPLEIQKYFGFAFLALFAVIILFPRVYRKQYLNMELGFRELLSSFQQWMQENKSITKIIVTWIIFIIAIVFAQFINDFSYFLPDDLAKFSENITAIITTRVIALALLSILNVYGISPFVKRLGKNNASRGFWSIMIGFFGLLICGPLLLATAGLGISFLVFGMITGIHIIIRGNSKSDNNEKNV